MIRAAAIGGLAVTIAIAAGVAVAQDVARRPQETAWQSAGAGMDGRGSGRSSLPRRNEVAARPVRPDATARIAAPPVSPRNFNPSATAPVAPAPPRNTVQQAAPNGPLETPFSEAELLAGKRMTEAECAAQPSAVWVAVAGTAECVVYYHTVGRNKPVRQPATSGKAVVAATANASSGIPNTTDAGSVVVFLTGDAVNVNSRGDVKPVPSYGKLTPKQMLNDSAGWANNLEVSYMTLARPGTYGSSGNHAMRRTEQEIAVVSAALDAIKARHSYDRLHLAGYAEGAHTAAMLMTRRDDLGCVVLASGLLSVKQQLAEVGRTLDWNGRPTLDPVTMRGRVVSQPALRILVMTDPDDLVYSARAQTAYVRRMDGLPIRQMFSAASDPTAHNLSNMARRMAADCAKGQPDDVLRQKYENKVPAEPPDVLDPPLHRSDALRRELSISEAQCIALKTALWLTVDGRKLCVRYWLSTAGGTKSEALAFFDGDLGAGDRDRLALNPAAERITAGQVQRIAHYWSRTYGGPYVEIARVGTLGSSGSHLRDRRTLFEVRVASAALDALKEKYGWTRVHLVGQSGGGHTVASLVQKRNDIGCAVMASGAMAVKLQHRDRGAVVGDFIRAKYDPYDFIAPMRPQAGRRMIVLSDPDDTVVPLNSQAAFVSRVKGAGLPILHLLAAAGDRNFHGLAGQGLRAASDCAKGVSDDELTKRYENKAVTASR